MQISSFSPTFSAGNPHRRVNNGAFRRCLEMLFKKRLIEPRQVVMPLARPTLLNSAVFSYPAPKDKPLLGSLYAITKGNGRVVFLLIDHTIARAKGVENGFLGIVLSNSCRERQWNPSPFGRALFDPLRHFDLQTKKLKPQGTAIAQQEDARVWGFQKYMPVRTRPIFTPRNSDFEVAAEAFEAAIKTAPLEVLIINEWKKRSC